MKPKRKIIAVMFLVTTLYASVRAQNITFESSSAFFPGLEESNSQKITWGYVNVPETWESRDSVRTIKIAVAILKNTDNIENANPVVFIQGGPGGSGIQTVRLWLNHPLRKKNDIILFDERGTGFSEPRLCPDLGKRFLEILAKDQTVEEDEKEKADAALVCKQELINKGIDITAYNSLSISKDIHALKTVLGYKTWNVYSVSYGTYVAQVYASYYRDDIKSLILDSPIHDISTYYENNTIGFVNSLNKVFEMCKGEKVCNEQYPNLQETFYSVIADLQLNPLTVSVDKAVISSGEFTYNAEDFKIAIQQSLYHKQLIEVIPLLIYQFHQRKKEPLANLVPAFSRLLRMDYGVYYCVSCNEVLPQNDFFDYQKNTLQYPQISGGLSFYKSDFKVCDAWNNNRMDTLQGHLDVSNLSSTVFPVLVFSGEFDPITPPANGKMVVERFSKGYLMEAYTYGHAPSFTKTGHDAVEEFIDKPDRIPDLKKFHKEKKVDVVTNVLINNGMSRLGKSISQLDPVFLFPLAIALVIILIFTFIYPLKIIRNRYASFPDKAVRLSITVTSIIGLVFIVCLLMALLKVSEQNLFILAFGLPEQFGYLFTLVFIFLGCLFLTLSYYTLTIRKTKDRSITFSVIFSNMLLAIYLFYWGII